MLGQEASFAYVFIIEMKDYKSVMVKKVGYLPCSLMLQNSPDLNILLVRSLLKDISGNTANKRGNEVLAAPDALSKLLCESLAPPFIDPLKELLKHSHPLVKKKAFVALHRMAELTEVQNLPDIVSALHSD